MKMVKGSIGRGNEPRAGRGGLAWGGCGAELGLNYVLSVLFVHVALLPVPINLMCPRTCRCGQCRVSGTCRCGQCRKGCGKE